MDITVDKDVHYNLFTIQHDTLPFEKLKIRDHDHGRDQQQCNHRQEGKEKEKEKEKEEEQKEQTNSNITHHRHVRNHGPTKQSKCTVKR